MSKELVTFEKPNIPDVWEYNVSVKKTKSLIYSWKNMTSSLAEELFIAREKLSTGGGYRYHKEVLGTKVPRTWDNYCTDIGSSRQVVNRWLKRWYEPDSVDMAHVGHSTGEFEWYTPKEYTDSAREVMGSIDLDPASCDSANLFVGADNYYTKEDSGLDKEWVGNVWMNPPYSQPLISEFSERLSEKYDRGEFEQACVLVNNATETNWFQNMLGRSSAVCFIKGRVKFIDREGSPGGAPLQGQAILYFGENVDRFYREFIKFGIIMCRREG